MEDKPLSEKRFLEIIEARAEKIEKQMKKDSFEMFITIIILCILLICLYFMLN